MTQIFAGTGYGQVFRLKIDLPKPKQRIQKIGSIKKQKIKNIIIQTPYSNQIYYTSQTNIYHAQLQHPFQTQLFSYKHSSSKLIGLTHTDTLNYHAFNDGAINILSTNQNKQYIMKQILKPKIQVNTKKHYNKFIFNNDDKHCLVGKEVLPFVYDRMKNLITWNGKNVMNDQLDLKVQINDIDATFFKNISSIACAHVHNKVRIYDIRSNRQKPLSDYHLKLDQVYNKTYLTRMIIQNKSDNLFYIANDIGAIYQCDIRKSMQVVGKFKGINSTITDMEIFQQKMFVSSLDCYVRVYDVESKTLIDKYYMNKPIHSIKINKNNTKQLQQFEQQALSEQQQIPQQTQQSKKMKKLRKRNKINLKYLKQVNWDQVPIDPELLKQAKQQYQEINQKDADGYVDEDQNQVKIKDQHLSDQEDSDLN